MGSVKTKLITSAIFVNSIYLAEAQNIGQSFLGNLRSGTLAESIKTIITTDAFLWLAFFALFVFVVKYGAQKMWPDMKSPQVSGIAISMGMILTYGLYRAGISSIFPQNNVLLFILSTGIVTLLIHTPKNKEGKHYVGIIPALIISLLLSWLVINLLTVSEGGAFSAVSNIFGPKQSDIQGRILTGTTGQGTVVTNDPAINYNLAIKSIEQYDYDKAKEYFERVVQYAAPSNPYYAKTTEWITIRGGDKLFVEMAKHYPPIMDTERAAAKILLEKARTLNRNDPKRKELLSRAKGYTQDIFDKDKILAEEFKRRGLPEAAP